MWSATGHRLSDGAMKILFLILLAGVFVVPLLSGRRGRFAPPKGRARRLLRNPLALVGIALLLSALAWLPQAKKLLDGETWCVTRSGHVYARDEQDLRRARASGLRAEAAPKERGVFPLAPGIKVLCVDEKDDLRLIRTPDGETGWVGREALECE